MHNDKICLICKFYGRITRGNHADVIFQRQNELKIHLCYGHSVDFFKNGQVPFIEKYRQVFQGYELLSEKVFSPHKMPFLSFK
jgi:hypothetical protein